MEGPKPALYHVVGAGDSAPVFWFLSTGSCPTLPGSLQVTASAVQADSPKQLKHDSLTLESRQGKQAY